MDNANLDKDDRFKDFAARASAEVLFALLAELLPGAAGGRGHTLPAPPPGAAGPVPGELKLQVVRRLHVDWQDLADVVGVPVFERARFARGDEPRALWEWLEVRGRLPELAGAPHEIDREDLADLLAPYSA